MSGFNIIPTVLKDAYIIEPFVSMDNRGGFVKCFEEKTFNDAGISFALSETFFSISSKDVLRGLHFQKKDPQAKIVGVLSGKVLDVIVDIRVGSPTFKQWVALELDDENNRFVFIPRGFAHGFVSYKDNTIMLYQCDGRYDPDTDTGILFNDPDLGIDWKLEDVQMIHSRRDLMMMSFEEYLREPFYYNS